MTIWIDAQLSPSIAEWICATFSVRASPLRELGLRDAKDLQIFRAAREADAVILTKDADFARLLAQHGPPPRVIWLTCGNTSNTNLQRILSATLLRAIALIESGESIVEISDAAVKA